MRKTNSLLLVLALVLSVASACREQNQPAVVPSSAASTGNTSPGAAPASAAGNSFDDWLGQWNGPEGTSLLLSKEKDRYSVKIQSLDGPATYEAAPVGDHLEFRRGGKTETIRRGSGKETGMKWLLDEKNCLIIKAGEGYCRK